MKRFFRFLAISGARTFRPLAAAATKSSWLGRVLFALVVSVWTTVAVMWATGWRLIEPGFPHTWQLAMVFVGGFIASLLMLRIFRGKREAGAKKGAMAATVPDGDGGDWLAKIYAIGDRVRWPGPTARPAAPPARTEKKYGWVIIQTVFIALALADVVATRGWFGFYWLAPLLIWIFQGVKNGKKISQQFLIFGGPIISGSLKLLWAGVWGIVTLARFLL